jgi:hypothetical protein
VVDSCFIGGFCEIWCANVVLLHGKRGELCGESVAGNATNFSGEKWDRLAGFIFRFDLWALVFELAMGAVACL